MSEAVLAAFGIASAVLNTIGLAPYVRDILRHKTKPERATWWIWLALNIIAFWAQVAAGARWSLLMTAAQLGAVVTIAVLSVKYGYGTFRRRDFISLLVAMFGLALWKFTSDPLAALIIVIAVDFLGFWLTLVKTWQAPYTETLLAWVLASLSGVFGVLAVGGWNLERSIYPLYIMLGNSALTAVILYRRRGVPSGA